MAADANRHWSFSPGGGGWANLSDVKFRATDAQGWIALVAASGGKAGIVNIGSEKDTEFRRQADRLRADQRRQPGQPREGTQTIDYAGAHGVLWDPTYELLWVVGKNRYSHYAVTGSKRGTRLKYAAHFSLGSGNLGHDLQPDYTSEALVG